MELTEKTIGEIVAGDYRTAIIFKNHKIDFCCKGNKTIDTVCEEKQLNKDMLLEELVEVMSLHKDTPGDFRSWDMDLLIDYIEKKHHRYVDTNLPVLIQYLDKLCKVHGAQHPELLEIKREFNECATELTAHMKKEELILFPYIRNMLKAVRTHHEAPVPHFGTIENPIRRMQHEHDAEGDRFRRIAALSNDYTPPADACATYRVTYNLLKEFEDNLHTHIHLENNILFPRSIKFESTLHTSVA